MPKQLKPEAKRKPGRPKLTADQAKGKIVPVRFAPDELERMQAAADANQQNLSQWIRTTLGAAMGEP